MNEIRIMVVEDDSVLRRTIVELLQLEPDFNVVSQAPNGHAALQEIPILKPDVVLMDIEMPRLNGIETTRQIKEQLPDTAVVILTKFGDDENLFSAIKAGASGYVLKDAGLDEIRHAVREAKQGEGHLNPALVARVISEFNRVAKALQDRKQVFAELSRREMEVLELIASGMKNKQIADKLFLSEKTVKSHIGSIFRKLHVNDRAEATMIAQQHGIGG